MASARLTRRSDEDWLRATPRIVQVDDRLGVEIAVADMTGDRRDQAHGVRCRAWSPRRIQPSRDRHATSVATESKPGRNALAAQ